MPAVTFPRARSAPQRSAARRNAGISMGRYTSPHSTPAAAPQATPAKVAAARLNSSASRSDTGTPAISAKSPDHTSAAISAAAETG